MKDLINEFEKDLNKEYIKYTVQKNIFCKYSGNVLDYRTCILIEAYKDNKLFGVQIISPNYADKLTDIKNAFLKQNIETKFITLNKSVSIPA